MAVGSNNLHSAALAMPADGENRAPQFFKVTASVTFALGVVIHSSRLLMGIESFLRNIFTPPVDVAFGLLILFAAIAGLLSWRRYTGGRAGRIGYAFAMFMLLVSVPIHLRTLWTWSTDYLLIFPAWYSAIEVPMFFAISYMVTQLKFDDASGSRR